MIRLKIIALFTAVTLVFLTILVISRRPEPDAETPPQSLPATNFCVVIDAGHGGIDGGVVGKNTGVKESELNLAISKKLKEKCEASGMKVVMTRENECGLYGLSLKNFKRRDLAARVEIIKQASPDIVISVHINKFADKRRRGAQVFYQGAFGEQKANEETLVKSVKLAETIQANLNAMPQSPRECIILKGDYYILNYSGFVSVLVECGFLSNDEDEALLTDENYQNELSTTILKGIIDYFV